MSGKSMLLIVAGVAAIGFVAYKVFTPSVAAVGGADWTATLVGQKQADAVKTARQYGFTVRVVSKDGKPVNATGAAKTNRVNVATVSGTVTSVQGIG